MTEADLKALVRTVPDFPAPGILFRDVTTLFADRDGFTATISSLATRAADLGAVAIAGIEARGFVLGAALAYRLALPFISLRKAGKLPVATISEDYALEYGTARLECDPLTVPVGGLVLLVDDLLATGGTALAAAKLLRRAGGTCTQALFAIELPDLGGAHALAMEGIKTTALMAFEGH